MESKLPYSVKLIIKIFTSAFCILFAFFAFSLGSSEKKFYNHEGWEIVNSVIVSSDMVKGNRGSCLETMIEYNKGGSVIIARLHVPRQCISPAREGLQEKYFIDRELFVKIMPDNHKIAVTKDYKNPGGDGFVLILVSIVLAFISLWILFMPVKKMWEEV